MCSIIDTIYNKALALDPQDSIVKVIAVVPIVSNIFFQIKSEHLSNADERQLKALGSIMYWGLRAQLLISGKPLAKIFERLVFKERLKMLVNLSVYLILSDAHINELTPD